MFNSDIQHVRSRLSLWESGSTESERLAAEILRCEGWKNVNPSQPLGGADGGKDAIAEKDGGKYICAFYFPYGRQTFTEIRKKFKDDLSGTARNNIKSIVFVTNQDITIGEKEKLRAVDASKNVEIFDLERVAQILSRESAGYLRNQYLGIRPVWNELDRPFKKLSLCFRLNRIYRVEEFSRYGISCEMFFKTTKRIKFCQYIKETKILGEKKVMAVEVQWEGLEKEKRITKGPNSGMEIFDEFSCITTQYDQHFSPFLKMSGYPDPYEPLIKFNDLDDAFFFFCLSETLLEKIDCVDLYADEHKIKVIQKEDFRLENKIKYCNFTEEFRDDELVKITPKGPSFFSINFY